MINHTEAAEPVNSKQQVDILVILVPIFIYMSLNGKIYNFPLRRKVERER